MFSAPAPVRVTEGGLYGPGLHAYAVVSKCADALPLYRISKRFARAGVEIARSSLTDLYHRTASLLEPLHKRLLELVAESDYVNADETSQPVMDEEKCRRGFIWTFISAGIIAYVFSKGRGGETAQRILKDTTGYLQVDGHTGYNVVCVPEKRERVGCIAHARRYFHKARDHCPVGCDVAFEYIRKLCRIEVDAAEADILGTAAHGILRRQRSMPVMEAFKVWLEEQKGLHDPKGPMGSAIKYCINQWPRLIKPLTDPKLRLDNNISEGALRIIAWARQFPLGWPRRGRREPRRASDHRRHLRRQRRQPAGLHRRRSHPDADPPGLRPRCAAAHELGRDGGDRHLTTRVRGPT